LAVYFTIIQAALAFGMLETDIKAKIREMLQNSSRIGVFVKELLMPYLNEEVCKDGE
jgi:hypothetical protein